MECKRKEYIFLWRIENYSYCSHKNGESLISPEFTDYSEGTAWNIKVYPRGQTEEYQNYLSIFLKRSTEDNGPEEVFITYEFSLLAADGSTFVSRNLGCTFRKGDGYGNATFLETDQVLLYLKSDYLPQETMIVQCKIWRGVGKSQRITRICARTRIGTELVSYDHIIECFSKLKPYEKNTKVISSKNGLPLSSSLYFSDDCCCNGKIMVEITPSGWNHVLSECNLYLQGESEEKIEYRQVCKQLNDTVKGIQKYTLFLTRQEILNRKDEYLKDDKLSLIYKCVFSSGVEFEKIEETVHGKYSAELNYFNNSVNSKNIYTEKLSACPSALDDFEAIYKNHFMADVELKTKTKSFCAHRNILCARSSVFKAMFSSDMKEKYTARIQIHDLEDDIVQKLLLFLYSDILEHLDWDAAIKLYYAGDKYSIEKLKLLCSSFLVKNLDISTSIELLLLADTHSDSDLKKTVEDFILKHDDHVFGSNEWGNLIETNPGLVSKTMRLKYTRKKIG